MRLEIELSDEDVGYLRRQLGKTRDGGTRFDIILKLAHALPRSIQVGDKVELHTRDNYRAVVLAIEGKCAWCGFNSVGEPFTERLSAMTLVSEGTP